MREGIKVCITADRVTSLGRQQVNSRAPELEIYFRTYLRASFHRRGVSCFHSRSTLVLHKQTRIATNRLVWTAVILNCSETSRPLSNVRTLRMYSHAVTCVYTIHWRSKGWFAQTASNPHHLQACVL